MNPRQGLRAVVDGLAVGKRFIQPRLKAQRPLEATGKQPVEHAEIHIFCDGTAFLP
nr:MAG TPA: hypothetical protein [Caudoviricetes sp.]